MGKVNLVEIGLFIYNTYSNSNSHQTLIKLSNTTPTSLHPRRQLATNLLIATDCSDC